MNLPIRLTAGEAGFFPFPFFEAMLTHWLTCAEGFPGSVEWQLLRVVHQMCML